MRKVNFTIVVQRHNGTAASASCYWRRGAPLECELSSNVWIKRMITKRMEAKVMITVLSIHSARMNERELIALCRAFLTPNNERFLMLTYDEILRRQDERPYTGTYPSDSLLTQPI